jgi:hypothetical protein
MTDGIDGIAEGRAIRDSGLKKSLSQETVGWDKFKKRHKGCSCYTPEPCTPEPINSRGQKTIKEESGLVAISKALILIPVSIFILILTGLLSALFPDLNKLPVLSEKEKKGEEEGS